jgi:hypothetical protein
MQSKSEQREGDFRKKLKNFYGGGDQVQRGGVEFANKGNRKGT